MLDSALGPGIVPFRTLTQAGLEASRPAGAYAFGPHIVMRFFGARYIPLPSVMPNLL